MTEPTIAQLHNLTDRAAHGLTADEQQRLRDGIDRLERAEAALAEARRIHRETCPLAQGKVGPGFTCGMCDTLDGVRPADTSPSGCGPHADGAECPCAPGCGCCKVAPAAAHNDGPSTAECAEADRAWPLQKAGE